MIRKCIQHLRESPGLLDLTLAVVDARVAVAGVNDLSAHLPMIPGGADTLKVSIGQRSAAGAVLTRVSEAEVALAQDILVHGPGLALEQAAGAGQQELILHEGGGGALGDAGLNVVSLDPLTQPLHGTVAVEWIRPQGPDRCIMIIFGEDMIIFMIPVIIMMDMVSRLLMMM